MSALQLQEESHTLNKQEFSQQLRRLKKAANSVVGPVRTTVFFSRDRSGCSPRAMVTRWCFGTASFWFVFSGSSSGSPREKHNTDNTEANSEQHRSPSPLVENHPDLVVVGTGFVFTRSDCYPSSCPRVTFSLPGSCCRPGLVHVALVKIWLRFAVILQTSRNR